jgi:chromosome segregation ATPase
MGQAGVLDQIKTQMVDLAQKNYELKQKYEQEVQAVDALKQEVADKARELKVIKAKYERKQKKLDSQRKALQAMYKKMDVVQSDILIKESRIPFLKKRLLEKQETYDLLKLQWEDLKLQKKNLQSKLNQETLSKASLEKELSNEIDRLKMRLQTNVNKQKSLSQLIIELEKNQFSYAQKKQEILHQNQKFRTLLHEYKQKRDLQARENIVLKDKLSLARKSLESDIKMRRIEKEQLRDDVKMLELEHSDLKQKMEKALRMKAQRIEYQKQMVDLDRQNSALRQKISRLRGELKAMKE